MTLKERLAKIDESGIYILKYKGEIVGYRVSIFDPNEAVYHHYDFGIGVLEDFDKSVYNRVKEYETRMKTIECVAQGTTCITEAELLGEVVVREFKDGENAVQVLVPVLGIIDKRQ